MNHEQFKHWIDWAAAGAAAATFFSWLPNIAAGLSAIWFLIRIYESKTVQRLLKTYCPWR